MLDERIPPFRPHLREKPAPSLWAMLIIFLFFLILLTLLFLQSPFSRVTKVDIEGNQLLQREEILEKIHFEPGMSFFAFRTINAKQALQRLPEIDQVQVEKIFPNQVRVHIKEFQPIAYLQEEGQQLLPLLENGAIIKSRPVSTIEEHKPIALKWSNRENDLQQVILEMAQLPEKIRRQILYIRPHPSAKDQVILFSQNQHQIFVRVNQLHDKMGVYSSFRNQMPGKVYLLESNWFSPQTSE